MDKGIEALIAALKLAMKSATPGQWSFARSGANMNVQAPVNLQRGGAAKVVMCSLKSSQWRNQLATAHDTAFIALANPENIKQLIAALEEANAMNKHLDLAIRKAEGCSEALRRRAEAAENRIAELEAAPNGIMQLSSADSTNVARNIGIDKAWAKSAYAPASKETRAAVLVERIESMNSASALRYDAERDRFTPQLSFEV